MTRSYEVGSGESLEGLYEDPGALPELVGACDDGQVGDVQAIVDAWFLGAFAGWPGGDWPERMARVLDEISGKEVTRGR